MRVDTKKIDFSGFGLDIQMNELEMLIFGHKIENLNDSPLNSFPVDLWRIVKKIKIKKTNFFFYNCFQHYHSITIFI